MPDKSVGRFLELLRDYGYAESTVDRYRVVLGAFETCSGGEFTAENYRKFTERKKTPDKVIVSKFMNWHQNDIMPENRRKAREKKEEAEKKKLAKAAEKERKKRLAELEKRMKPQPKPYDYIYGKRCIYKDSHSAMWKG